MTLKRTKTSTQIFRDHAGVLSRKCIELALAGDMAAMKLAIERAIPVRKGSLVQVNVPQLDTLEACKKASDILLYNTPRKGDQAARAQPVYTTPAARSHDPSALFGGKRGLLLQADDAKTATPHARIRAAGEVRFTNRLFRITA